MKDFTIDAKDFLNREKKVLGYLRGKTCLQSIANAASTAYYGTSPSGFNFTVTWPVINKDNNDEEKILEITIAGIVGLDKQENFEFSSYVLSISQDGYLLRKYHYDCECTPGNNKPFYHLQYGGQPLPEHDKYEGIKELIPWLSEPRLFYTPMSLALILEQAFLEFPDDATEKIRNESHWKGHVKASEKAILKPYFERCCQKISQNECLYSECYI